MPVSATTADCTAHPNGSVDTYCVEGSSSGAHKGVNARKGGCAGSGAFGKDGVGGGGEGGGIGGGGEAGQPRRWGRPLGSKSAPKTRIDSRGRRRKEEKKRGNKKEKNMGNKDSNIPLLPLAALRRQHLEQAVKIYFAGEYEDPGLSVAGVERSFGPLVNGRLQRMLFKEAVAEVCRVCRYEDAHSSKELGAGSSGGGVSGGSSNGSSSGSVGVCGEIGNSSQPLQQIYETALAQWANNSILTLRQAAERCQICRYCCKGQSGYESLHKYAFG